MIKLFIVFVHDGLKIKLTTVVFKDTGKGGIKGIFSREKLQLNSIG
jgi:hypothetical protein